MRYPKLFVNSVLLFTTPALIAHPPGQVSAVSVQTHEIPDIGSLQPQNIHLLTYDEMMNFINEVEKGDLERCSPELLEEISERLAQLAKEGFSPTEFDDGSELENDIQELLDDEDTVYAFKRPFAVDEDYTYAPAFVNGEWKAIPCSFIGKKCHQIRKFVKKHKKAIIIGAVVAVAVTVIVLTYGAATPAAAAGIAETVKSQNDHEHTHSKNEESETSSSTEPVQEVVKDHVRASIKEQIAGDELLQNSASSESREPLTFAEIARGVASTIVHEVYDEVAQFIPPPLNLPKLTYSPSNEVEQSPGEIRKECIAAGHQKIDEAFSTELAGLYTPEYQAKNETVIGILPPPWGISKGIDPSKIKEVIATNGQAAVLAEELGFSTREIIQLKEVGALENTVANTFESIVSDAAQLRSLEKFRRAETLLKSYQGLNLSELEARELIHRTGVRTFPRPEGIPDNFKIKFSNKGAGLKYVHPDHNHTSIRVMPGKTHSPFPHQRDPYVNHRANGKSLDKFGKVVSKDAPEAHIPINEFVYKEN